MDKEIRELYQKTFDEEATSVSPIHAHASDRKIFRVSGPNRTVVGIANFNRPENKAFVEFSRHFKRYGLPVAEIYAFSDDQLIYLEEDLGDTTLYEALGKARSEADPFPPKIERLYEKVVQILPRFQIEAGKSIDFSLCYQRQSYDRQAMLTDMLYFKEHFLTRAQVPFDNQKLENDFSALTEFLAQEPAEFFLYRDFQARNIMVRNTDLYFIDYQSGRKGALQYDVASLLYQSQARIPDDARERLLKIYLASASAIAPIDEAAFLRSFYGFVYIRLMQVLGTYGRQGLGEGKRYFLEGIPYAAHTVNQLVARVGLPLELPELSRLFGTLDSLADKILQKAAGGTRDLTVSVLSFSYKSGVPVDASSHGGGFVFDCRCLPNPGREESYSEKTGLDPEVVGYMRSKPQVDTFIQYTFYLVDQAVENFLDRKFNHLLISFGCTGGQHRSVYLAEALAAHLRTNHPVNVVVEHTELAKRVDECL